MYYFSPQDRAYGSFIQRTQLLPLIDKGGSVWFCTFTFPSIYKTIRDEDISKRYVCPLMLNLARQSQSTITPFVGWWCYSEDTRKHTHIHAAIHSTSTKLSPDLIYQEWKELGGGHVRKIEAFDTEKEGLSYIYGQHQRRDTGFWERPFTPPRDHKTGEYRKPLTKLDRFLYKSKNSAARFSPKVIRRINRSQTQ